jgi:hypothetical protein
LKFLLALEIAGRVFQRLPTARASFAVGFLVALVAIAAAIAPTVGADVETVAKVGLPRLLYGTALAFAGLLCACLWYHVPLHPIHKAVLLGLVPYLLAFTVVLQVLETFGWVARGLANHINTIAFVSLLAFWARVAWRPFIAAEVSPTVLMFLQPWVRPRRA